MIVSEMRPEECVVFDSDEGRHEIFPGIVVWIYWLHEDDKVGWFWRMSPQNEESQRGVRSSSYALHEAVRHAQTLGIEEATYQ